MYEVKEGTRNTLAARAFQQLAGIDYISVYDVFSGNASVGGYFKRKGKQVLASDVLHSAYWYSKAFLDNKNDTLTPQHFNQIVDTTKEAEAGGYFEAWADHYFTREEARLLGLWWANINAQGFLNDNLKAVAYAAVYLTMAYWLNFNQKGYFATKAMTPHEILKYYVQQVNHLVYDNGKDNVSYCSDAYAIAPSLPLDVALIFPPALEGYRQTSQKTYLAECWTRCVTQLNMEGVLESDGQPKLGEALDAANYAFALERLLDICQGSDYWLISHHERMGISLEQLETLIKQRGRRVWQIDTVPMGPPSSPTAQSSTLLVVITE